MTVYYANLFMANFHKFLGISSILKKIYQRMILPDPDTKNVYPQPPFVSISTISFIIPQTTSFKNSSDTRWISA